MSNQNQHNPGYKHTPIGWIPEEWEVKEVNDIATLSSGTTPFRQNHAKFFQDGSIPWVKTTDLNNSDILRTEEMVTEVALKETSLKLLPAGTILVAMYGGFNQIGRTGLLRIQATVNQALTAIQLKNGDDPKYILEWFNYRVGYWKNFAGSSRKDPNITSKDVGDFPVIVATEPEQRKIATILSTWDEAITKTQQLITQLQQRNKGLMQQLLTCKKRLKGFEEEWRKFHATDIFKSVSVKNNGTERLLSATQDRGIIPRDMLEARVTMPTGETGSFKLVEIGDFVISLRSFQGGIEYSEYRGLVSPAYTVLKPTKPISTSFFKHYFKSYDFIGHLAVAVIGIRDGKQVSYEDFSILKLPYPDVDEQVAIAKVLDAAVDEVKLYEQKLAALHQQKKGLMQKLLTGEVRTI